MSGKAVIKISRQTPQVKMIEVPKGELSLDFLRLNVGDSSSNNVCIECVYRNFLDMPSVVIVCDDSGKLKNFPTTYVTRHGDSIAGDIIICKMERNEDGERDLYGMPIQFCLRFLSRIFPVELNQLKIVPLEE